MKWMLKKIFLDTIINLCLKITTFFSLKYYSLIYHPLIIRKNTTDILIFRSIFIFKEFELPIKIKPRFIIDGGAYTGLSSLYYSSKYPNAKIFAVEPEESNFEILEKHTRKNLNITRIKAGLWHKEAFLKIVNGKTGKWDFTVKEVAEFEPNSIKAVTIDDLLKRSGFDEIDILKLDIEGSEKELFSKNYSSWINKVNIIVIELHDWMREGCAKSLYSAINQDEWKKYKSGEKLVLIKK
ncbi:MAG: FkbM family methyltransferase [Patescibacteria group bacterium]|nr:FkbM family methyltransferase [Patescibacteria group bacterium]